MNKLNYLLSLLLVGGLFFFASCGEDEEPETLPPTLSFTDTDGVTTSQRSQTVSIEVNILAQGGLKSLTANGTPVTVTAGANTEQKVTYPFAVGATEPTGEKSIEFVVTDNKERTASATYKVNVIGSTVSVSSDITTATTWEEGNIYELTKTIAVKSGAVLTIKEGVNVLALDDGKPVKDATKLISAFIVEPGGRVEAIGTANRPIVFSVKPQGTAAPAPGMWAGVILQGNTTNTNDLNYNAGTLRYVRVEFGGGDRVTPTSDKGGLTLTNVGRGTTIEFVQVFKSLGEGFRIEGSKVALKNCVATDNLTANLNLRHTGTTTANNIVHADIYVQFFVSNTTPTFVNGFPTSATLRDKDSRDLLISNPPTGFSGNTLVAANMTFIGPGRSFTVATGPSSSDGMRAESRAGRVIIRNSIFAEFPEDGIRLSNNVTTTNSVIDNSFFFQIGGTDATGISTQGNSTALRENAVVFAAAPYANTISPASVGIAGIGVNDFTPGASQVSPYNPTSLNDNNFQFQSGAFVGAISTTDWTLNWTKNADGNVRR